MSRPTLARVAAACAATLPAALVAQAPAPAGADEPLLVESCTTEALPVEDVQEGATSVIDCEWVEPGDMALRLMANNLIGTHYTLASGSGSYLNVFGSCGESISFGSSDPWNNEISSTRHRTCAGIKHFDYANLGGDSEANSLSPGVLVNLTYMNNRTSSVAYGT